MCARDRAENTLCERNAITKPPTAHYCAPARTTGQAEDRWPTKLTECAGKAQQLEPVFYAPLEVSLSLFQGQPDRGTCSTPKGLTMTSSHNSDFVDIQLYPTISRSD